MPGRSRPIAESANQRFIIGRGSYGLPGAKVNRQKRACPDRSGAGKGLACLRQDRNGYERHDQAEEGQDDRHRYCQFTFREHARFSST